MVKRVICGCLIIAGCVFILFPLANYIYRSKNAPEIQYGTMTEELHRLFEERRAELGALRTAAESGGEPDAALARAIQGSNLDELDIGEVSFRDGWVIIRGDNAMYTGIRAYTTVWLVDQAPDLLDGLAAEPGQTLWVIDKWMRVEAFPNGWYAVYVCRERG